eukprot:1082793-Prorocentrum_minimum.AAC.4
MLSTSRNRVLWSLKPDLCNVVKQPNGSFGASYEAYWLYGMAGRTYTTFTLPTPRRVPLKHVRLRKFTERTDRSGNR